MRRSPGARSSLPCAAFRRGMATAQVGLLVAGVLLFGPELRAEPPGPDRPTEAARLPLPVVGRWAETLPLHGGPVFDLFRLPIPEPPWLTRAWAGRGLTLHAGLAVESGGLSSSTLRDQTGQQRTLTLVRTLSELVLSGHRRWSGPLVVAWDVAAALDQETLALASEGDEPHHRVELRARAGLRVTMPRRAELRLAVELLRRERFPPPWEWTRTSDVVDVRADTSVALGRRLSLHGGYHLTGYLTESEPAHPARALDHLLRLHLQARVRRGMSVGVLADLGILDVGRPIEALFESSGYGRLPPLDGFTTRALVTLSGRPRPWVACRLGLGWGARFLPEYPYPQRRLLGVHASVAHAGVSFRLAEVVDLELGYWHDLEPLGVFADLLRSDITQMLIRFPYETNSFMEVDAVFVTLKALPWGRLSAQATAGWRGWAFSRPGFYPYASDALAPCRVDTCRAHQVVVRLAVDGYVSRGASVGLSYLLQAGLPEMVYPTSPDPNAGLAHSGFVQHRAVVRLALRY